MNYSDIVYSREGLARAYEESVKREQAAQRKAEKARADAHELLQLQAACVETDFKSTIRSLATKAKNVVHIKDITDEALITLVCGIARDYGEAEEKFVSSMVKIGMKCSPD
jgi:hypothetical protein